MGLKLTVFPTFFPFGAPKVSLPFLMSLCVRDRVVRLADVWALNWRLELITPVCCLGLPPVPSTRSMADLSPSVSQRNHHREKMMHINPIYNMEYNYSDWLTDVKQQVIMQHPRSSHAPSFSILVRELILSRRAWFLSVKFKTLPKTVPLLNVVPPSFSIFFSRCLIIAVFPTPDSPEKTWC